MKGDPLGIELEDIWNMHKPESHLENEIHKIPSNFEIQTDHPIPARSHKLIFINKKRTYHQVESTVSADNIVKRKEKEQILLKN